VKRAFIIGLFAAALASSACASDPGRPKIFSTDWLDDQGKSISDVHARLRGAQPGASADLVVAVAGNNDKIIGLPLSGGAQWTHQHALDTRPIIAGGVVVASGGNEVFALDAATGKKLWARPTGGVPLLGAGDDGAITAVSLSRGGGSTLLIVGRDGAVRRQIETDKAIGDPAVVAGVVFVPWANQYVSAIDPATGDEIGRVTLRDKVSRALTIGGTLYFGELAYVRFDERIGQASRGNASRVAIPSRELPGTPRLLVPGTERLPPAANARDRDRLFARPSGGEGQLGVDSNRFYASYFRLAFGFDSQKGNLGWVHTHGADLIGGEAIPGGLLVCDETGKLTMLDARTGSVAAEKSFGEPIRSCVVQADSFRAPGASNAAPPLVQQITDALLTREASLATAHRLLLRELATMDDEIATKTLIELASDPRTSPVVVTDARAALATRRNGAGHMIAALGRHYDYLKDILTGPPVGPLADALAAMKETKAAPLLAAHLLDPNIPDEDVRRAGAALAVLATPAEKKPLETFFAMYRGSAETEDVGMAVGSVGEALLRIDPKGGRATVEAAVKDRMTIDATRQRLQALLTAQPAPAPSSEATPPEDKPADKKPADKPGEKKPADKPAEKKPAEKPAEKKPAEKPAEKK
jgi:outer membrane protein assembly factor BamB